MKSYTDYIWMNTKNRYEIVNITSEVEEKQVLRPLFVVGPFEGLTKLMHNLKRS
mgnify:CR=1 FL=1